jgi:hypothetical protein
VQKGNDTRAAIGDLRKIFPKVPAGAPEAINENSTYLHLIDCYLEQQAVIRLLGELKARQVMRSLIAPATSRPSSAPTN